MAKQAGENTEVSQEPQVEKRKMPVRIEELELDGSYAEWRFSANRNFTFGELEDLASLTYVRMLRALKQTVTSWANFVDRDGEPIAFMTKAEIETDKARFDKEQQAFTVHIQNPLTKTPPKEPEPAHDPWQELGGDLIVAMARAVAGLPSIPNR